MRRGKKNENYKKEKEFWAKERLASDGDGLERVYINSYLEDSPQGKSAQTLFKVLHQEGNYVLGLAFPQTGRQHQIRVHATVLDTPILGDGKYGAKEAFIDGAISKKLHLHARSIEIDHPDGGILSVKATLPTHMQDSFELFDFDANDETNPFEEMDDV